MAYKLLRHTYVACNHTNKEGQPVIKCWLTFLYTTCLNFVRFVMPTVKGPHLR